MIRGGNIGFWQCDHQGSPNAYKFFASEFTLDKTLIDTFWIMSICSYFLAPHYHGMVSNKFMFWYFRMYGLSSDFQICLHLCMNDWEAILQMQENGDIDESFHLNKIIII